MDQLSWGSRLLLVTLAVVTLWELAAPRRRLVAARGLRWPTNFTLAPLNGLLATLPLSPLAFAVIAAERGWGLRTALDVAAWPTILVALPLLDLLAYLQHRLLHAVPVLWSFHRVHHADPDVDCTTALRFHPLEALATNATLMAAIAVLGLPPLAVLIHQLVATTLTVLEHANARVPSALESRIAALLITPSLHRVHHSDGVHGNFGTIFTVWDRWLGTYRPPRPDAEEAMPLGIPELGEPKYQTLPWTLALPFVRLTTYPLR